MAAFEISAKNRKNRENNKREQARPKKISHLAEASGFISRLILRAPYGAACKKPGASPPGLVPDCAFCHQTRNVSSPCVRQQKENFNKKISSRQFQIAEFCIAYPFCGDLEISKQL
jgi:hypothetical protein